MNERQDPNRTVDVPSTPVGNEPHQTGHSVDHSSVPLLSVAVARRLLAEDEIHSYQPPAGYPL
jgi:hypothetical protein